MDMGSGQGRAGRIAAARVIAIAVGITACVALLGWALNVAELKSLNPEWAPMKPNTAIGLLLLSAGLYLAALPYGGPRHRMAQRILSAVAILISVMTLSEHGFSADYGIDQLLFTEDTPSPGATAPARMSVGTATSILLLGLSLAGLGSRAARRHPALTHLPAMAASLVGLLAVVGYLYGVSALRSVLPFSSMALHTALCLLALGVGMLCAQPGAGPVAQVLDRSARGLLLRQLLPAMLLGPLALGWLVLAGEQAGWYEESFAMAVYAMAAVLLLMLVIMRASAAVGRFEAELSRTDETLRLRWREMEAVYASAPVMLFQMDRDCRFVRVNRTMAEQYRLTPAEMQGRSVRELAPAMADMLIARYQSVMAGRVPLSEVETAGSLPGRPGTHYWLSSYSPLEGDDGEVFGLVGASLDITSRKQSERLLAAANLRLERAQQHANIGDWTVEMPSGKVAWSTQMHRMFGLPMKAEPTIKYFMSRIHPDDRRGVAAAYAALSREEVWPATLNFRSNPEHGPVRHYFATLHLERGPDRRPLRAEGTLLDITDMKRAEDDIRAMATSLERRVAERTLDLEHANRELESFSYSVSHDLKAPLRAMGGYAAILGDDHGRELSAEAVNLIELIREGARRMGALIDDILRLSKVRRVEMRVARVDLSAMARIIIARMQQDEPEREVEVRIEEGLYASGDGRLIEAALDNLLANAWKFSSRTPHARITVGRNAGDPPVFYVRDNGAGFDMENARVLFTPFKRLHSEHEFPGTGVGLATVERVIARHKGRIWAESRLGEGATFYFTLPDPGEALAA